MIASVRMSQCGIRLHLVGSPTQAPRVDTMHARDVSAIGSLKVVTSLRTETDKKGVNYGFPFEPDEMLHIRCITVFRSSVLSSNAKVRAENNEICEL